MISRFKKIILFQRQGRSASIKTQRAEIKCLDREYIKIKAIFEINVIVVLASGMYEKTISRRLYRILLENLFET
jgi:hypothetical protein